MINLAEARGLCFKTINFQIIDQFQEATVKKPY